MTETRKTNKDGEGEHYKRGVEMGNFKTLRKFPDRY